MSAAAQRRHPPAAKDQRLVRLGARRDLEVRRAVERRHLDRRPQRRQRRRNVDGRQEIVAVADEPLVRRDAHEHVQVARRPASIAGVTAPGDADPLAVGDPRRNLDGHLLGLDGATAATAHPARLRRNSSVALALVADRGRITCPKGVRVTARSWPAAAAARARLDRSPGLGAVAVAVLAQCHGVEPDLGGGAGRRFGEGQLDRRRNVAALDRAPGTAAAEYVAESAPEERLEDVGDRTEALEVRGVAAAAQAVMAVAVVGRAALGVGQDLIGLGSLLELLLCGRVVAIDVGVQLAGQAAERLLDVAVAGVARNAKDVVVVAFGRLGAHRSVCLNARPHRSS